MTAKLKRRVFGYPCPYIYSGVHDLNVGASATVNLPAGPGELLNLGIWDFAHIANSYYDLDIEIKVDGIVVYTGRWRDLINTSTNYVMHGLFGTSDISTGDFYCSSYAAKIPYESTCSVKLTNSGAAAMHVVLAILARRGA